MVSKALSRQERDLSVFRCTLICLVVGGLAVCGPLWAGSWCDVVFKDVARDAATVVLTRVDQSKDERPILYVTDVLKGECDQAVVSLSKRELERHGLKHGDQVLLALDDDLLPIRATRGLGVCEVISLLPIHKGRLRSEHRADYDSGRKPMTLDELRQELRALPGASGHVGLDG